MTASEKGKDMEALWDKTSCITARVERLQAKLDRVVALLAVTGKESEPLAEEIQRQYLNCMDAKGQLSMLKDYLKIMIRDQEKKLLAAKPRKRKLDCLE